MNRARRSRVLTIDGLDELLGIGVPAGSSEAPPEGGPPAGYVPPEGGPPPAKKPPPKGGGWPAALTPDGQWWTADKTSPSGWSYRVHYGFTVSGAAATYLGMHERWKDLWNYQSSGFKSQWSPSKIDVGVLFRMPPEAVDMARKLGVLPGGGTVIAIVAAVVAGVAVVGGIIAAIVAGGSKR